jgi:two-component sensor histidine kinase
LFLQADRVAIFQFEPESFFEQGTIVAESVVQPFTSTLNSVLQESCFSRNYALKYQQGRIQTVSDIYQSDLLPCHIDFLAQFQVRANLVLPLISNDILWGLLCIHQCSQARTWQETEINLLKQITNQFEIAIQKASLYKQAQQELAAKQKLFLQLTNELEQKKILLKEIHHRVKNNLQIMSSLLYLQFSKASPEIQQLSEDYQNRIQSMALIHEQLYRSEDLANINFEQYLKNLTYHIFQSYGVEPGAITLNLRVNSLTVPLEQSIPLGLIAQELVSNALKHAFPQGAGEITIELTPQAGGLCLTVADNGAGLPLELDLANTDSLGLQLIYSLTEQLQGELSYETGDGCQFQITFPN